MTRWILDELIEEPVEFKVGEELRRDIVSKKRKRNLQNVTIKTDPLQFKVIRKLATRNDSLSDINQALARGRNQEGIGFR